MEGKFRFRVRNFEEKREREFEETRRGDWMCMDKREKLQRKEQNAKGRQKIAVPQLR